MPILPNAKKALRQSQKRAARNKLVQAEIHSLRVHIRKAVAAGDKTKAEQLVREAIKKLSKAATKRVIHKNKASRTVSRLTKKVNTLTK